ncbi:hypothetical protein ACUHMQ_08345 [Chitinimonas sp. PSY-7]|uniref:hypothetical protein n=1 Tax=Chitinimonas sp. PSY-7 TaxID=3459088 RepID=UPI0040400CE5
MTQHASNEIAWRELLGPSRQFTQDSAAVMPAGLAGLLEQLHRNAAPLREQSIAKLKAGEISLPPAARSWWLAKLEETQLQSLLQQEGLQFDLSPALNHQMEALLNRLDMATLNKPAVVARPAKKQGFWARLVSVFRDYDRMVLAGFALAAAALSVVLEVQNSGELGLDESWSPSSSHHIPASDAIPAGGASRAEAQVSGDVAASRQSGHQRDIAHAAPRIVAKSTQPQAPAKKVVSAPNASGNVAAREEGMAPQADAVAPPPAPAPAAPVPAAAYESAAHQAEPVPRSKLMRAPVVAPLVADTTAAQIEALMSQGEVRQAHLRWCEQRQRQPDLDQQIRPTYRDQLLQLSCPSTLAQ